MARIGLFTTASSDPVGSADYYVDMFVNVYGAASATYIPVTETSNNADDLALVDLVGRQTGIFFGGGDQLRVTTALRPNGTDSLVLSAVKNLLTSGGVVGGTSAGTACQVCFNRPSSNSLSTIVFLVWGRYGHRWKHVGRANVRHFPAANEQL